MATLREFDITAFSIPVVYTPEGDYDPNGMVFIPSAMRNLLDWCRKLWFDQNERLPRLHHRAQRARLVIDGLERLEAMIARLRNGGSHDQALLARWIAREMGESGTIAITTKAIPITNATIIAAIMN